MLLLRLLSTVLCATCVVLLATFQPVRVEILQPAPHRGPAGSAERDAAPGSAAAGVPINVVDVAPGVSPAQIAAMVQLRSDEHVSAINDRVAVSDLEAGALIASLPRPGGFVDLTVSSPSAERRVLVLLH